MTDYTLPRPTATTSATSPDALKDNAVTFNKLLNEPENQTTYQGKELISWQGALDLFGFGVASFDFTAGGTLDSKNQLIRHSDELLYRYIGAGSFPLAVAPATDPVGNPDWEAFTATSHNLLSDRNSAGAHNSSAIDWSEYEQKAASIANQSHRFNVYNYMSLAQQLDVLSENPTISVSDAFQNAVNDAISAGVKSIFVPLSQRQRYRLDSTVNIESSGFCVMGDAFPQFNLDGYTGPLEPSEGAGYIFSDTVTSLFDYGNNRTNLTSNQFVARGVNFYSKNKLITKYAIRKSHNNNGPHRGFLLSQCSAGNFESVLFFDTTAPNVASASVVIENCAFRGNEYTARAEDQVFNFKMSGCQSEQGARLIGWLDGAVSITDNMLEGQTNPVSINSFTAQVLVQNNYFELNKGEYLVNAESTTLDSSIRISPNYIVKPECKDLYRLKGQWSIDEQYRNRQTGSTIATRRANITCNDLTITPNSNLYGQMYAPLLAEGLGLPLKVYGFCNPSHLTTKSMQVEKQDLGTFDSGISKTSVKYTGLSQSFIQLDRSYTAGDFVIVTALVEVDNGDGTGKPLLRVYNEAGNTIMFSASQFAYKDEFDDLQVMVIGGYVSESGSSINLIFGPSESEVSPTNGAEITVISVGASLGSPVTFLDDAGAPIGTRQYFEVCNPFNAGKPLEYTVNENIPDIVNNGFYTFTIPCALAELGDNVNTSVNVNIDGIELHSWVSTAGVVRVRMINRTGSSKTFGLVGFKTIVTK